MSSAMREVERPTRRSAVSPSLKRSSALARSWCSITRHVPWGRFSGSELAKRISTATGHPFTEGFGCFSDPIDAILEDVERLKTYTGLVHRDKVRGFMYDLAANTLTEVHRPQTRETHP